MVLPMVGFSRRTQFINVPNNATVNSSRRRHSSLSNECAELAETPIAAAASISPRPNTTGKSGNMSIREGARLMVLTETAKTERRSFAILANSDYDMNVRSALVAKLSAA